MGNKNRLRLNNLKGKLKSGTIKVKEHIKSRTYGMGKNIKNGAYKIKDNIKSETHKFKRNIKDETIRFKDNIKSGTDKLKKDIISGDIKINLRTHTEKLKKKAIELKKDVQKKLYALLFIALAGVGFWVLMNLLYLFFGFDVITWVKSLPYVYDIFRHFFDNISARTDLGIYYLFSFSSVFIWPMPLEILYLTFLKQGFAFERIYLLVVLGIITGQHINYLIGRFFGFLIKPYIKKRTRIELKRRLYKYGIYAVFFMHLFPLPYAVFNFVTGLTRFSYLRWLITMVPALLLNFYISYLAFKWIL